MLEALINMMLWDGVALVGFAAIIIPGLFRGGDTRPAILLAASIPATNSVLAVGYYFYWWDQPGFISFAVTAVMAAAILLIVLPWVQFHSTA